MTGQEQPSNGRQARRGWLLAAVLVAALAGAAVWQLRHEAAEPANNVAEAAPEATAEQVHAFCGACHAYPPPDSFPRGSWRDEVNQGYEFYETADPNRKAQLVPPPREEVIQYYTRRAPERLPVLRLDDSVTPCPVRFDPYHLPGPPGQSPGVAHLNLVRLRDPRRLDLLLCDMMTGTVAVADPTKQPLQWTTLSRLHNPAHAEMVDLDGDKVNDLVVADLGKPSPSDELRGEVVWLRGKADGTFTAVPLLTHVGRVTDVQPADVDGDGDLDLIVAVFGWRQTGQILWLENQTTDWSKPKFVPHELDPRHGAIHVPVADLNGDGRPDFVALISQEHETVVAFLNEGGGRFRKEVVYTAPHPAWGSSGIQLVDLDKDGDLDVLYTNGDTLDSYQLKPFHGVHWLENRGTYPFVPHHLTDLYGVHRAVAADADGDGDLDVFAVSCVMPDSLKSHGHPIASVVLLEQMAGGRFIRHVLERNGANHLTCVAGDWNGDGRAGLAVGHISLGGPGTRPGIGVTLWENRGRRPER
jgi:hypothetical protein